MSNAIFSPPMAVNEPVYSYEPGSEEREKLKQAIAELKAEKKDIPMFINGKEVRTDKLVSMHPPYELKTNLGNYHFGNASHVKDAIKAALGARKKWAEMSWEHRASIFLKAAELIAGPYRYKMNAATMLAQSKNPYQSEIEIGRAHV